jgi:anaerobic selenocysteine-containing dehydrogenase
MSGTFPLNDQALDRPDLMLKSPLGRVARVVNMSQLGKALNQLGDPPVKAVFVYNSNPAVIAPNQSDVVKGFLRPDLFTVVHEQFFTDTTSYADLILPATTFFEQKDLVKSYGHTYLQVSHQAISPLGECKSNTALFAELAQRMGFTDDCFRQTVDDMIDVTVANPGSSFASSKYALWMEGITRERLEKEGHVRLNLGDGPFLPFAEGNFPTASGKAELFSQQLAAQGLDPVASFIAPEESRHTQQAHEFPLELLSRKADNFLNSTFANLSSIQKMEQPDLLEMHSSDAAIRGIREGDWVRVFNHRGQVKLRAHVNGSVQPGVVAARLTWAKLSPSQKSINQLTSETLTDIGRGPSFYSCLVDVQRDAGT